MGDYTMKKGNEREGSTKEHILHVTLELIKNEGFDGVTVRKIANRADVNIGLINYYFGSKEKLLNASIQLLIRSLREIFMILDDQSLPPKNRLKQFLVKYLTTHEQYPFIIRKLINEEPIIFESQKEFIEFVKAIGLKKVYNTIKELTGEQDEEKLTIMMTHVLGAIMAPMLIEPLYKKVTGEVLPDKEKRIDLFIERYFGVTETESK